MPLANNTESSLGPFEGIAHEPGGFFSLWKNGSEREEVSPTRLGSRPADFAGESLKLSEEGSQRTVRRVTTVQ